MEKTKVVNFNHDDFDFLGFTFQHWRERKKDGKRYYIAKPKAATWRDFRAKIKDKTRKTLTLDKKTWLDRVNPIIRGKVNYFLNLYKAVEENKKYGQQSRCFITACKNDLLAVDGYVRHRLRVAMIHNHPTQRKGHALTTKWNNEYFARIGLIPAYWLYYNAILGHSIEDYIQHMKDKQTAKKAREMDRMKERGKVYFTPDRVRKIQYANRLATY